MKRKLLILLFVTAAIACGVFYFPPHHRANRIPTEARHALDSDSNLVLYSLDPDGVLARDSGDIQRLRDQQKFHGYRILGQTVLASPDSRHIVVDTIRDAVRNYNGPMAACFEPRHGIRATDASGTHDFVICFACSQVFVFSPGGMMKHLGIHPCAKPLNDILSAAHVPLPTR